MSIFFASATKHDEQFVTQAGGPDVNRQSSKRVCFFGNVMVFLYFARHAPVLCYHKTFLHFAVPLAPFLGHDRTTGKEQVPLRESHVQHWSGFRVERGMRGKRYR